MRGADFVDLLAAEDGELADRWEALLAKAPRLRTYIETELCRHRLELEERVATPEDVERTLCDRLGRWLAEFEALPQFAVSAIATTLEDDGIAASRRPEADSDAAELADALSATPERAASEIELLLSDPVFALALHCVDARIRPQLASATADAPELGRVPEAAWFGLLHASAPATPLLTPEVAIGLVLRVSGTEWTRVPAASRKAALRLFGCGPADLRGIGAGESAQRVCDSLPAAWGIAPAQLPAFVAAAGRVRLAASEASGLFRRIAACVALAARPGERGGFALVHDDGAPPASREELGELVRCARNHAGMAGFRRLLSLL